MNKHLNATVEDIKHVYPQYEEPDLTSWAEWLWEGIQTELPKLITVTLGQTCDKLNNT